MKHKNLTSCAMRFEHVQRTQEHVRIPLPTLMKLTIKIIVK